METSIRCQQHQEFLVQYIFFQQKNIKFGCVECISELQDENQSVNIFKNILLLHDRPQKLLSQISNIDDQTLQFYSRFHKKTVSIITQAFQNWENNMRNFQKQIDNIILQQKGFVEELIANYKNTMQQLSHEIKFEEFQNLIKEFGTANEKLQNDVLDQISHKITQHFESLDKNNAKQLNESLKRIKQEYLKYQENINLPDVQEFQNSFQYMIKSTDDLHSQIGKSLNFVNQMNSAIIPNSYSKYLIGLIKNKLNQDIKQIKVIYLGSRDGLNGQSLWNKIDGKEHLIYIFKSKNPGNYVFGSYVSCKVKQDLNNWQSDESLSSFIFSYTHNEIYPLKQSERQHAILCQPISYAVWIGMSGNIGICNDFINGQSYLGSSYEWDKFENKRSSHLFGGDTPNIEECEVYELQI
ncbi:unnamed protein product (macronuclear) [Paramecium tetraurelia]|uniref:TLDc domain-containing protein n=1 Tax=Paramecium tetraurelia TaxID=5888 RepID=A0CP31_PARTE|nr:uncharacterized protein GSPATT00008939001 [Paramecium tetraurelia]CAK72548.1 unnamed protein product [Paramecium tetraurelia]|eukprot:XP_001439945.1 hypothetical protein (macronuclear) [Paramecium tetraurelia strain d4-2]